MRETCGRMQLHFLDERNDVNTSAQTNRQKYYRRIDLMT